MGEPTQTGSALDSSSAAVQPVAKRPASADLPARFEDVKELARGGMGRVLVAFDRLNQREVALKEALSASDSTVKRFEREAFLTAALQHPGVVPVYEVARKASGEPYLVMRRVQGRPFSQAIAEAKTLEARLALMGRLLSVVDTVAYAHTQSVIHRDLKPSNVLLGEFGDTVVIDWGLAKRVGEAEPIAPSDVETVSHELTRAGSVLGTLAYMSPEQLSGGAVDPRSDVYALGAILYELLSGAPPHGKDTGGTGPRRAADPLAVKVPDAPPELAAVVAKAMALEPTQRYPNAAALAKDLEAFQTGRLVSAHQYSVGQLIGRWARRNAPVLLAVGISLVVLSVLAVVSVRRVLEARDRANREAAVASQVSDFMVQLFKVVDPSEARGKTVTAKEILDRGSSNLSKSLGDPEVRARMARTMGEVYSGLGSYAKSRELLEQAAAEREKLFGQDDPELLRIKSRIAAVLFSQGKLADSEKLAREVLGRQTKVSGPESLDTLTTLYVLGDALRDQNHYVEAEKLHRQVYEGRKKQLGSEARATLLAYGRIGDDVHEQARYDESVKIFEETLKRRKAALGEDDPDTMWAMNGLSGAYQKLGRQADAEKVDTEAMELRKRVLGPEHPSTLDSMLALGNDHFDRGDFAGAEKLYEQVQTIRTRILGPEHMWTLAAGNNRANAIIEQGRLEEGEKMHLQIHEIRTRVLGADHAHTMLEEEALGDVYRREKKFDEARKWFHRSLDNRTRVFGPEAPGIGSLYYGLAMTDADEGKYDAAFDNVKLALDHHIDPQDLGHMLVEPSFKPMMDLPRWKELFKGVKTPATP
ncbi:MAG: serine/threonine-protein kinase [Myxococcaceae bacterium]